MKYLIALASLIFCIPAQAAERMDCGIVSIDVVLAGPRHGAMMQVSNTSCGNGGWVCLDPDGEHMSENESDRLYSFVLASKMANQQVKVWSYTDIFASACGSYPVIEDIRTP
jgi:hypothetical protein